MTGYVYAVGNREFVKIGYSAKPVHRASKIKSDAAFDCTLFGFVSASRQQEGALHELLSEYRHNREWFYRGSAAVEHFISSISPPEVSLSRATIGGLRRVDIARRMGVDKSQITRWVRTGVPPTRVIEFERVTGISRHDLRPDIYPRSGAPA